jgi:hypothetical protein
MSIFVNCKNTLSKGGLGLAKAIFEYQKSGYNVALPLVDNQDYDLIIEKDDKFQSVQCKASSEKSKNGKYIVGLRTVKTNTKITVTKHRGKYDLLFVLFDNGDCYSIPSNVLPKSSLTLTEKYIVYKL